ncbi:hypothetical protein COT20_02170 [bacterium (Candidatus Gribaldobacteria) CG08_land_8_20_14_0_20_39_15]|uniref:PKD domain-containing protein n=1 Tax=bacterium (Candidatus Gribaldobacteria) CG08_land_8_20_14_0_20_39_15 TaxID=2014273 RepID=A0A2M6XU57_9BACT|nr:MAG: hypothetical protein COT20_02170 [bacterium (Candidatus Gribaldobacteria) CG08_land_8_20_14_0_20_39_15]
MRMRIFLKMILITALLCFTFCPPNFIFAQSDNLLNEEQISGYLLISEKDNQQIMHSLIQLLTNELIDIISSTNREPREDAVFATLLWSMKINTLKFLLLDAPVEVIQKVIITSIKMVKMAHGIAGITDLGDVIGIIEKETAKRAVEYGLNALLRNDIRVASGTLNTDFVSYKNNPQEVIFQYVIVLKPISEKKWGIAINILSKDSFEPPPSQYKTPWRLDDWLAKGNTKIEPFIISVQGQIQKGDYGNYQWVGIPNIEISFPDNVPDLGFRPLGFWQKHLWKPIESQIREATVILKKFLPNTDKIVDGIEDASSKILQVGQVIKNAAVNLGSKINNYFQNINTGANIAGFSYPNSPNPTTINTPFTVLSNSNSPQERLTMTIEPTKTSETGLQNKIAIEPADQLSAIQVQLSALIERIDDIAEQTDELVASQSQIIVKNNISQAGPAGAKAPEQSTASSIKASNAPQSNSSEQATSTANLIQTKNAAINNQLNNQPDNQPTSNQPISQPMSQSTIIPPPSSVQILISEVKTESQNSAKDEYIELYNPNSFAIDLSGFILRKKTNSTLVSSAKFKGAIPAFGYFLITPQSAATGNLHYSGASYYIIQTNSIILYDKYERLIDKTENVVHPRTHSFGRKSLNAASDFEVQSPTPGADNQKDTIAPQITLLIWPSATTSTTTAEFSFTTSEPDCIFEYQLDNDSWQQTNEEQPSIKFKNLAQGQHSFQIRARDPVGNWANPLQYFWEIVVPPNQPPIAVFSYSPSEIFVNEPVIFNAASSIDPDGAVVSYTWNFGDSAATTTQTAIINHQFSAPGQFQTTLVVNDDKGVASNPTTATIVAISQPKILISEIQTEGEKKAHNFIELYNPTNSDIKLKNYRLVKRAKTSNKDTTIKSWSMDNEAKILASHYYLWVSNEDESYSLLAGADAATSQAIANDNGIALRHGEKNTGAIIDAVGWGDFNNVLFETTPSPNHPKGYALGRKWLEATNEYQDTDNNQNDFEIQIPTPGAKNEKDITPPQVEIISKPPALTNQAQAIFSFSSNEEGSTFQCNLNNGDWQECVSPETFNNLADGFYTFYLKASDLIGNLCESIQYAWTIDTTIASPSLILADSETNSLSLTNKQTVKASISQDEDAAFWFLSENSGKPIAEDTGWLADKPLDFNLSPNDGAKTVFVWTKDAADNVSQLGNAASIMLDTLPPETIIEQSPGTSTNQTQSAFVFSSNEAGANFLCKLDVAAWQDCASSTVFSGLNEGTHSLDVKATDLAFNTDESPVQYNWFIDLTPPLSWIENIATSSTSTTVLVRWNGSDIDSGILNYDIQYREDINGEWQNFVQTTTSLQANFTGKDGQTYYFRSKARDIAGNEKNWPEEAETFCKIEIPAPILDVFTTPLTSPTTLAFSGPQGAGNPPSQNLIIHNSGNTEMAWSISFASNWVLAATTSGVLLANSSTSLEISVNSSILDVGSYQSTSTITAENATNSPQNIQITLTIEEPPNQAPSSAFSYSPSENLLAGDAIFFDASSSTDDGEITAFIWDFGDGSTTTAQTATTSHIFNTVGQFQILLIVQDDKLATSSPVSATLATEARPESRLVISEVQVRDDIPATNNFIEIFNPTDQNIDISDLQLKKRNSNGTEYSIRVFPANSTIPANSYFLWANSGYIMPGLTPDATSTQTLASNNSIALFYSDHTTIIDQVAWGTSTNSFVETTPFSQNPTNNQTLTRKKDDSGNYIDTNNNAADFILDSPSPTNSQGQTISPATNTPAYDPSLPVITDLQTAASANREAIDLWWNNKGTPKYIINYNNQSRIVIGTSTGIFITATVENLTAGQNATFTVQYIKTNGATSGPSNIAFATPLLGFQDNNDGTINDLYSGLMWVKDGAGLAANNGQTLSWFAAKDFCEKLVMCQNNEFAITSSTSSEQAIAACSDKGGVKYDDWRLPGFKELAGLIQYKKTGPTIDQNYFQNITTGKYWSASFKKFIRYGPTTKIWHVRSVDFSSGAVIIDDVRLNETLVPFIYNYILPVRGDSMVIAVSGFEEPQTGCSLGYQNNGNSTYTDLCTGLMWSNTLTLPYGGTVVWQAALREADSSTLGGYTDWRLPNVQELLGIIRILNSSSVHWSITPDYQANKRRWFVDLGSLFQTGQAQTSAESAARYVKLVRGQ